jgi:hypothetical protein
MKQTEQHKRTREDNRQTSLDEISNYLELHNSIVTFRSTCGIAYKTRGTQLGVGKHGMRTLKCNEKD